MSWPHPIEAELHITSEFVRCGVDFHPSGQRNFKINCPFPHGDGVDKNYHLEITRDGRKAHCWVCNWSGSWNKLAKAIGAAEFNSKVYENTFTDVVAKADVFGKLLATLNSSLVDQETEDSLPHGITDWKDPVWRGLNLKFLKKIPSFKWSQRVKTQRGVLTVDRILWPYYQYGRLVGYVGRRLDKSKFQKYYRAPWCHAKQVLFPFDYVREHHEGCDSIVLVEGEVDALNLLQAGIPALSILGSTNWSDDKVDLLCSLNVNKVYILMDPDNAGREAEVEIRLSLLSHFDYVKVLHIDGDDDPGSLDKDQLSWLKEKVLQEAS